MASSQTAILMKSWIIWTLNLIILWSYVINLDHRIYGVKDAQGNWNLYHTVGGKGLED